MTQKKVVIIGAGPGGLSAGMILAAKGFDVQVYEEKDRVGGRNSSFSLGPYTFDLGPTFFMMIDVLQDIFKLAGKTLEDYVGLERIEPMYRLDFSPDKVFYPTTDRQAMKQELERVFPGNVAGYETYLKKEKKKYDALIPCLAMPYDSLASFFKLRFITSLPYLHAHKSLFRHLSKYFRDDELALALTFQAKYIGMSPWEAPATFSIISFIEHGGGIYHVMGGLNQLSQAMAKVIEEHSGSIHLSQGVKQVLVEHGRAIGVELQDGTNVLADAVVINSDFAHAMTRLVAPEHRSKYTDNKLKRMKYSCSTFMLYLGLDTLYDIPHHNIIFAQDYRKNVAEMVNQRVLSKDPSFYIQNASRTDDSLAPEGHSAVYVLVPVPNNRSAIDWQKEKGAFRDRILDIMEGRGDMPELRSHIKEERIITPYDWEHDKNVYLGATFNLAHGFDQMLIFRPHNRFQEFDNCYLVGGGTHPGSGLPTIYESGRISADLIMERFA